MFRRCSDVVPTANVARSLRVRRFLHTHKSARWRRRFAITKRSRALNTTRLRLRLRLILPPPRPAPLLRQGGKPVPKIETSKPRDHEPDRARPRPSSWTIDALNRSIDDKEGDHNRVKSANFDMNVRPCIQYICDVMSTISISGRRVRLCLAQDLVEVWYRSMIICPAFAFSISVM